jgi:hypothetical protein
MDTLRKMQSVKTTLPNTHFVLITKSSQDMVQLFIVKTVQLLQFQCKSYFIVDTTDSNFFSAHSVTHSEYPLHV